MQSKRLYSKGEVESSGEGMAINPYIANVQNMVSCYHC